MKDVGSLQQLARIVTKSDLFALSCMTSVSCSDTIVVTLSDWCDTVDCGSAIQLGEKGKSGAADFLWCMET